MSIEIDFNDNTYEIPEFRDTNWANQVTSYLVAISTGTLQPSGGAFTLTAETDFGANFGLKSLYYKSRTANPASAGQIRLATGDTIKFRNNANGGDIALSKDTSDNLQWNSTKLLLSGAVVNADINAAAAIAYSKLALTGSVVNADISASAAIAYSKLALTGTIVNADVSASAAIAYSKLALTGTIVNADVSSSAAIARSKLASGTADHVVINSGAGVLSSEAQLAVTRGGTGQSSFTDGQLLIGNTSGNTLTKAALTGTSNQVVVTNGNGSITLSLPQNVATSSDVQFGTLGLGAAVDSKAILSLSSTTKGFLPPKMTTTQRDAIVSPTEGLVIYNTSTGQVNVYASGSWAALAASGGGTVNTGTQYQLTYYAANGTTVSGLTAITAAKALVSDTNGLPVASTVTTTELQGLAGLTASRALVTSAGGVVSVSSVTATELGYVAGVTSAIQTQLNLLAPKASPTFTGTVVIPTPFTLGAVSVTATGTELNYVAGVTSAIQTQLNAKAPTASPTFSGTITTPLTASRALVTGASNELAVSSTTATELGYVNGVTSAIQTQMDLKAPLANPTFTGTVTVPGITSTNDVKVSATKKVFLDGGGDTYIIESSANVFDIVAGGTTSLSLTATDVYTTAFTDYGSTSTVVGWGTFTTKSIYYKKIGKTVFVYFSLDGTSNATNITFTLPFTVANNVDLWGTCRAFDNGSAVTTPGHWEVDKNSATVTCFKDAASGAWTNANRKIVSGQFTYQTA